MTSGMPPHSAHAQAVAYSDASNASACSGDCGARSMLRDNYSDEQAALLDQHRNAAGNSHARGPELLPRSGEGMANLLSPLAAKRASKKTEGGQENSCPSPIGILLIS